MKIAKEHLDLESLKWGEFKLCDFFKNYHGKRLIERDRINGNNPLLTAGESNNGVSAFIANEEMKFYKDFISIDMFGNAFYHSYKATGDDNIYFFVNDDFSSYVKLFFVSCINKQKDKFSYGKQFRQQNADNLKIILPKTSQNQPDFEFMEKFMRELESKHLHKILSYYQYKLQNSSGGGGALEFNYKDYQAFNAKNSSFLEGSLMELARENLSLEKIEWGEFVIGEIFDISSTKSGIDKNKLNTQKGNYPYITRTDRQNGIDDFIATQEKYTLNESNVISIGLDTQTAFYQNAIFYTGQNIQILKHKKLNKYNALFIIITLKKLMTKFNWGGNGATLTRLKRGKILLPKNSQNKPDFEFMEKFMRALEYKKIHQILSFYQNKNNATCL